MQLARIPVKKAAATPSTPSLTESTIEPIVKQLVPILTRFLEHQWAEIVNSVNPAIGAAPERLRIDFSPLSLRIGDESRWALYQVTVKEDPKSFPVVDKLVDRLVEELRPRLPPGFSLRRLPPKPWSSAPYGMDDLIGCSMMRLSQDCD